MSLISNWKTYKNQLPTTIFRDDLLKDYSDNINTLTTDALEKLIMINKLVAVRKGIRDYTKILPNIKLVVRGDGLLPKLIDSEVDNRLFVKNKEGGVDFVPTLLNIAKRVNDNYDDVIKLINESFGEKSDKNILDYYQLNILRYLSSIEFFITFINRINSILTKELYLLMNVDKDKVETDAQALSVSKNAVWNADEAFINDVNNIHYFCVVVDMITKRIADYKKAIYQLDGHMYNEADWEGVIIPAVKSKLDPFNCNGFIVSWNPIYYAGMYWNQLRNSVNQRNKVELTRLKLMAMYAQDELNQSSDSERIERLNRELGIHNNTINKLEASIRSYEES